MVQNIQSMKEHAEANEAEIQALDSLQSPIVLLKRGISSKVASSVTFGSPYLGIMLPYTPLHYLMMKEK